MTTENTKNEPPAQFDWNDQSHFTQPKRIFKVEYDTFSDAFSFSFTVELTLSDAVLHEINNFWSNRQSRLDAAEGNIAKAVVGLLTSEILIYCRDADCINNPYFTKKFMSEREGWPDKGINITEIYWEWMVSNDDFTVTEVQS